jgi:hypothetical protein
MNKKDYLILSGFTTKYFIGFSVSAVRGEYVM